MGQGPHARRRSGVGAPDRVWKTCCEHATFSPLSDGRHGAGAPCLEEVGGWGPRPGLENMTAGMGQGPHARRRVGVGAPTRVWRNYLPPTSPLRSTFRTASPAPLIGVMAITPSAAAPTSVVPSVSSSAFTSPPYMWTKTPGLSSANNRS